MNQRFYSLDVFRGATVALMILVNNPGTWSHIYSPLEHAAWHGLTPTDLVFPFFLFAVGNAMAFVMPRLQSGGDALFWKKVLKRTLLIFLIGLFLNWSPFVMWNNDHLMLKGWTWLDGEGNKHGVRIMGVLQRIALCYFFASVLVYYLKPKGAFYAGMVLLLLYWMLCYILNPSDPYSLSGWFGTAIDKKILGEIHMYKGEGIYFDPEGIMSTIPAIVQVIFGYLVGDYIQKKSGENYVNQSGSLGSLPAGFIAAVGQGKFFEMVSGLFVIGVALLVAGYSWDMVFPINKKIWTSSYTIYTSGLAIITIATMIYMIEIKNARGWLSRFFDVFGKNPLFIFVLSGFLPRVLALIRIPDGIDENGKRIFTSPFGWFYENVCKPIPGNPEIGSLIYAISMIIFFWAICYWLDRRKIYIKV